MRSPFNTALPSVSRPIKAPAPAKVPRDNRILKPPAVLAPITPIFTKRKGVIAIIMEQRGVAKLINADNKALSFNDSLWYVLSRLTNIALSRSATSFSPSSISASYMLTPEDIPKAMLLLIRVSVISLISGLGTKAEPDTTPSRVKVASNSVLMKNLRILDPISIFSSQSNLIDHGV